MNLQKITLFAFLLLVSGLSAQKYAYKFGEVGLPELEANKYAGDTTATAVIIAEYAYRTISQSTYSPWTRVKLPVIPSRGWAENRYYDLFPYVIETELQRKIKIMKPGGKKYSEVKIPYYNIKAPYREQIIDKIDAWSYNLENGQLVKTQLKKENILTEIINDSVSQIRFVIPGVQVGSVIEYKYRKTIPLHLGIPDWEFQSDIPSMVSLYETLYYDAFVVNQEVKGPLEIKNINEKEHPAFTGVRHNVFAGRNALRTLLLAQNIPARKPVDKVWNVRDHTPGVRSELLGTRYVGYVPYADKWQDVENRISVENPFDKYNYGPMIFSKEIKALIKPIKDEKKRIEAIYRFVKDKVKWNGKYELYADPIPAVNSGYGSNAQINAILLRALYRSKFYVYPILLSPRSEGRLPLSFPSYDRLKTYIICVQTSDGNRYYLDGSAENGGLNMLPPNLMVEMGRTFARSFMLEEGQSNGNVNLTTINSADYNMKIIADIAENGKLQGRVLNEYNNLAALYFKNNFQKTAKSLTWMMEEPGAERNTISDYTVNNPLDKMSSKVVEQFHFSQKTTLGDDGELIFNPLIFSDYLFDQTIEEHRVLPVEFENPLRYTIRSEIEIPTEYALVHIPKSEIKKLPSDTFDFSYKLDYLEGKLLLEYELEMKKIVFAPSDLSELRELLHLISEKNKALVILKKKSSLAQ